jgi:hypothetical protein
MGHVNLAQIVVDRELVRPDEDVAVMTQHWRAANIAFPDDDNAMTGDDRDHATQKIINFLNGIIGFISSKYVFKEVRWYDVKTDGTPSGPPLQVGPLGIAGTSSNSALPPQVACSVTFKTAIRKNWGRFYIPGIQAGELAPQGYFLTPMLVQIADYAVELCDRGGTTTQTLTVWSPTERTHHDPQVVQVDDVPDVIRSRRFSSTLHREVRAAG